MGVFYFSSERDNQFKLRGLKRRKITYITSEKFKFKAVINPYLLEVRYCKRAA